MCRVPVLPLYDLDLDLRLNYLLWRSIFVSAPEIFIFSHRFMTFGMYVHFKETMCCIPILKIVHNYHTSIFPVLQVHKFHLHRTHWWGPHEMAPISMVSSYTSSHDQNFDFNWQHLVFRSMWLFLCCAILWPSRYQCCVSNITVFKWLF